MRKQSPAVSVLPNLFPYKDFKFEVITYEEWQRITAISRLLERLKRNRL